jgi:hypothetical protein
MLMLSELIRQAQEHLSSHGDIPVMVYDNGTDRQFEQLDTEFNDDVPDEPVILISLDSKEEDS